jgi:acyl-CoA reductase-like NAD-dependent aldehyde dehydrogenase
MSFLNVLQTEELAVVEEYLQPIRFPKNSCILQEGDPGDGCYVVDEGEVRLEIRSMETDSDGVLGYRQGPDLFLGEFSLLDGRPRSASAYADTDVDARWLSKAAFEKLCEQHPKIGLTITTALGQGLTDKLRQYIERVSGYIFADEIDAQTNEMVARAVVAQQSFQNWSEERIDALLKDIAEAIVAQAEVLAEATVAETGLGVVADKVIKNRFAGLEVYKMLVGQPASGLWRVNEERQITEFVSPVGVVLALIPLTNPVATIIFKALICLKGRNALIFSCHRNALQVGNQTGEIIQTVLQHHGAPSDLVQWIRERTSRRKTAMFMKHPDVAFILATGGPSMVRAAYSSGTPAIGVGQGNAPVWICADADPAATAKIIIQSKSFDNGIICGSENNLVVDASIQRTFIEMLKEHGAAVLTPDETRRLAAQVFDSETGYLQREIVGQSAKVIARSAGIHREHDVRLIVAPVPLQELSGPYGREKLVPILSLFTVNGEAEGLSVCKQLLDNQGHGHTAIIHTKNQDLAKRFGTEIPASRILVNSPGSQGCIGMGNGLTPSLTLGCGTLGGNSTTDNVTYSHLLNIKRLAHAL